MHYAKICPPVAFAQFHNRTEIERSTKTQHTRITPDDKPSVERLGKIAALALAQGMVGAEA